MVTVNKRSGVPQAMTINGITPGGIMTIQLQSGFDNTMKSAPDGLQVPIIDREVQFVRGSAVTQDWSLFADLLTGAVGTLVVYEQKSGAATYVKHTINNPVIYRASIRINKSGYAAAAFDFECRAADETKGIVDMHTMLDDQEAPTYISAARGGWRVISAVHGSTNIYHTTGFNFQIAMPLAKACNDSDVGYTCVDARLSGMSAGGDISFQDGTIATAVLLVNTLLTAAKASLVLTLAQSSGGGNKTITINGVDFGGGGVNSDSGPNSFTGYTLGFDVCNDTTTQLTLAGAGVNAIVAIA